MAGPAATTDNHCAPAAGDDDRTPTAGDSSGDRPRARDPDLGSSAIHVRSPDPGHDAVLDSPAGDVVHAATATGIADGH